jgi:hypothetical protein
MHILYTDEGMILGDAAEALGCLKISQARDRLEYLLSSPIEWVASKSRWALKQISAEQEKK